MYTKHTWTNLTCETAHASSGFSSRSNENSINTLHAAATDSNWFLGTGHTKEKEKKDYWHVTGTRLIWAKAYMYIIITIVTPFHKHTYFVHKLWWCNVQKAPRKTSRTAHTAYRDEVSQIHYKRRQWKMKTKKTKTRAPAHAHTLACAIVDMRCK